MSNSNTKKIEVIDGQLLLAILKGGRVIKHLSRTDEDTNISGHVVIVEMPKDVIIDELQLTKERKYWKYLVFLDTPNMKGWWHASSNNLSKRDNEKKAWNEWSDLKYTLKPKVL